jgi:demethylmenaquinone methyltransferase / 2-methoxy-6-polyprenyl-1,4-benzoquinol methylase
MFDAIADRYDFLNHLLSAGIDRRWRARAVRSLSLTGRERVLDLCTGTGDLAIAALAGYPRASRVVGIDFAGAMLKIGASKIGARRLQDRIGLVRGDATRIPLADASVDAITIGFGIRNVESADTACAEMRRVLVPAGRIAVLEFAIPSAPGVRQLYSWYFNRLLPIVGRMVSRHRAAYTYLPASVGAFASPDQFVTTLRNHGFVDVTAVPMTFGIVCLYTGHSGSATASRGPGIRPKDDGRRESALD